MRHVCNARHGFHPLRSQVAAPGPAQDQPGPGGKIDGIVHSGSSPFPSLCRDFPKPDLARDPAKRFAPDQLRWTLTERLNILATKARERPGERDKNG